jgi:ATP-dependent DNA ligase
MSAAGNAVRNLDLYKQLAEAIELCRKDSLVLDGELYTPNLEFPAILSCVADQTQSAEWLKFWCFDLLTAQEWYENENVRPFCRRHSSLTRNLRDIANTVLPETTVEDSADTIVDLYNESILNGKEGLILRTEILGYTHSYAQYRYGNFLRMKNQEELDGVVIGFSSLQKGDTTGAREYDNLGRLRSITRVGETFEIEELGSIRVRLENGLEVSVGSGFNYRRGDRDRKLLWLERDTLLGKWVTLKAGRQAGYEKPRQPIFARWRDPK